MRKFIENIFMAGAFLMTLQSARGFSLAEPIGLNGDAWQTIEIGYGVNDTVAPADIYEEYRPVVPVMYYACDASFLSYYGETGLTNIDAAFGILNGALCGLTNTPVFLYSPTNGVTLPGNGLPGGVAVTLTASNTVDRYSADLSEFPLENQQQNYTAETLGLMDIKSFVLREAVLELGLADAPRYVWTLHDRLLNPALQNPTCPQDEQYLVVPRNYDVNPTQNYPYSAYINSSLYLFQIEENCGKGSTPWSARTFPYPADGVGNAFLPVTAGGLYQGNLYLGAYYTSLTRDDAAGLKYLLSSNNINWEPASAQSQAFTVTTNFDTPQLFPPNGASSNAGTNGVSVGFYYFNGNTNGGFGYGDLAAFLAFAKTNDPATLQAAYPGVVVSSVGVNWVEATNQTYTSYYAPAAVGSPYGSPPRLVVVTNYTHYFQFLYNYTFANVFTNHYTTNGYALMQTVSASTPVGAPYGYSIFSTNTVKIKKQNSGDFFVLPPFYTGVCPLDIVSKGIATVVATTNILTGATTNVTTTTSTNTATTNYASSVYLITYFTNYQYVTYPVTCGQPTNNGAALRRGIGRVEFIRANYDSLLGQLFQPLTNYYSMVKIVNSQPVKEYYERVATAPDFLFQSQDLTVPTQDFPYGPDYTITSPVFDSSAITTQLAGPGTVMPDTTFVFNKNENLLYLAESLNEADKGTNAFLDSTDITQMYGWGSFDGSTNYPVYYPDSASIANLMNQMIIQATPSPASLDGTSGQPYSVTFTVSGGQPPYVLAAPGLAVPGLAFDPATATLSGTPTVTTSINFTLQVTDSANRVVSLNYPITIH